MMVEDRQVELVASYRAYCAERAASPRRCGASTNPPARARSR